MCVRCEAFSVNTQLRSQTREFNFTFAPKFFTKKKSRKKRFDFSDATNLAATKKWIKKLFFFFDIYDFLRDFSESRVIGLLRRCVFCRRELAVATELFGEGFLKRKMHTQHTKKTDIHRQTSSFSSAHKRRVCALHIFAHTKWQARLGNSNKMVGRGKSCV